LIHGRGRGVQRAAVHGVIARLPWIVRAYEAPPDRGGWGATVVVLAVPDRKITLETD
jgi:dsDNA-specific endonuclease/ATPase MutS2